MISLTPIGTVNNTRHVVEDDNWGDVISVIELDSSSGEDTLAGLTDFSHAEIVFYFHLVEEHKVETGARHPRIT
jgi:tRNA (adenine37-N6)-methyltransferase